MSYNKYYQMAENARGLINDTFDYDIEAELLLYTPDTGPKLIKSLLERIDPDQWEEYYNTKEFYDTALAQAFVGPTANAIIFQTETNDNNLRLQHAMIHEYAHIFVLRNEQGGKLINTKLHKGDSAFFCGYKIWGEFIADYLASCLDSIYKPLNANELEKAVKDDLITIANSASLYPYNQTGPYANILRNVFYSYAFIRKNNWNEFKKYCDKHLPMDLLGYSIELVYKQICNRQKDCWEITEDFVEELGTSFKSALIKIWAAELESKQSNQKA